MDEKWKRNETYISVGHDSYSIPSLFVVELLIWVISRVTQVEQKIGNKTL